MKTQILIALGAVAVLAGVANAQTVPGNGDGVHLKKAPDFGPLLRPPMKPAPQHNSSDFQFKFIPNVGPSSGAPVTRLFPDLDGKQMAGTRLTVVKSPEGRLLQVESAERSIGDVLRTVTEVMGVQAIIDPKLQTRSLANLVFRGKDFDDLLDLMSRALNIEMVKSPEGTYFFASKPASSQQTSKKPGNLRNGPFLFEPSENTPNPDPDFSPLHPKPIQPQHNWEKRDFNGHEFYYIPGSPQPDLAK